METRLVLPSPKHSKLLTRAGFGALVTIWLLASTALPAAAQEVAPADAATLSQTTDDASSGGAGWGARIFDAAVLRPLGALSLVGGSIFFVVTSPLVLPSRIIDFETSWDVFVVAPWEYTVERPLGEI